MGKLIHGHARRGSRTKEYNAWRGMRQRCSDPKHPSYSDYGGRGITVCARWRDFTNFLVDLGPHPGPSYSLERKDVDGPYAPWNCCWATRSAQNKNLREPEIPWDFDGW